MKLITKTVSHTKVNQYFIVVFPIHQSAQSLLITLHFTKIRLNFKISETVHRTLKVTQCH